ncbi:MAG: hypothetical protein P4L57_13265 [Rhizomicrobium sp.]|nr:hypothetical protein [Rhizomicrobium sp.]
MGRTGCLLLFSAMLCGCVSTSAIDDQQAIAIASKTCAATWAKTLQKEGGAWQVGPSEWHARLDGSSWKVWTGDEASPVLLMRVPRSGRSSTACDLRFVD